MRGELFYRHRIAGLASLSCEVADYETGARLVGEARRKGKGNPSLVDGLLAAIALRKGGKGCDKEHQGFPRDELSLRESLRPLSPPPGSVTAGCTR
jgi:predicted nucleic acid-binding protein